MKKTFKKFKLTDLIGKNVDGITAVICGVKTTLRSCQWEPSKDGDWLYLRYDKVAPLCGYSGWKHPNQTVYDTVIVDSKRFQEAN